MPPEGMDDILKQYTSFPGPDEASDDNAIRNVLDLRIEKLEQAIRVLKGHRQSLAPIFRLPDEILAKIITSYQALFEPISSTPFPAETGQVDPTQCEWIRITFVCRRLRYIALNECPRIWADILMHPRWASKFLERSKAVPIHLRIESAAPRTLPLNEVPSLASIIEHHAHRAKDLLLRVVFSDTLKELLHKLPPSAPHLEYLSIHHTRTTSFSPPSDILWDTSAPNLRRLKLKGFMFPWTASIFHPSLTSLSIGDIPEGRWLALNSAQVMLDALACMNGLEFLALDVTPVTNGTLSSLNSHMTVHLTSLKALHLYGPGEDCARLLRFLSLPTLTVFRAACRSDSLRSLLDWVANSFSGGRHHQSPGMRRLRFRRTSDHFSETFHFEGWTGAPGATLDSTSLTIDDDDDDNSQLNISFTIDRHINPPTICAFMECLRLDDVVHLDIALATEGPQQWMRHVGQMKQFEELHIESAWDLEYFLDLWITLNSPVPFHIPLARGEERLRTSHYADSFPRLNTLALRKFDGRYFSGGAAGDGEGELFGKFMHALVQRARISGEKLRELRIVDSFILEGMVDKFRNVVGTVLLDQVERQW
ncbi:uncharacterized protein STEHIDRAFT_123214 [Stereum hirsutum FP-91666 SS1]|uniref:uncharacterized protein n=1 Tax=Stereum hirsutum (strain FP-91666) TaxID=721885 RepID=UPI0004449E3A|nr:uncharacterized protein STEHIDRAFT_123214 [Stereum hirsutum FP-91666 SS1]EIM84412.1 hypothetical protein STEHIDRAFT_123214 [Stereum hirsutum FP-91666 SS1]